jgi:hypothetical protein
MEVLFRFLNWVSSFHTVDEESGNKMDTWNIATVMAPNILRESNDKEMRNVDQGAVKVVFDLIENNDEFSEVRRLTPLSYDPTLLTQIQVPPEIMELLNDDTSSDMSAKEIMRQWEQRGKNPLSAPAPGTSPRNQGGAASKKDQRNAPQITPADSNPQPYAGEASLRHIGPGGQPQQDPGMMEKPKPAFGRSNTSEEQRNQSPNRHSYRSPAGGWQGQGKPQIGTAGAG